MDTNKLQSLFDLLDEVMNDKETKRGMLSPAHELQKYVALELLRRKHESTT